jgi:hypothetical protein
MNQKIKQILQGILVVGLAIAMAYGIIYANEQFTVVGTTTPTQIISGRARIQRITYGNPDTSENSVTFYDHTASTTTYLTSAILRMDAPAGGMTTIEFPHDLETIDFAVCISTHDLTALKTYTSGYLVITYK